MLSRGSPMPLLLSHAASADAPPWFRLRMSALFAALLAASGVFLPYFPLWLDHVGLNANEIALVVGAPMVLRVVSNPLIAGRADRMSDRAGVLVLTAALSFLVSLGLFAPASFVLALAVSLGLSAIWPVQTSLADSIAVDGVRRFGVDYSRMRVWGSFSFLIANFAGGLVLAGFGAGAVPAMFSACLFFSVVAAAAAPRIGVARVEASPGFVAVPLRRQPRLMRGLVAIGLIQASHALLWSFGSIFWRSLGLGETTIGTLWTVAVVAEVGIFLLYSRLLGRWDARSLIVLAGMAGAARWLLFPWADRFGLWTFFPIQALHALSTGLVLIGVQKMIAESVPETQTGAAQGWAFFFTNLGMALATLAAGPLYGALGGDAFFVMAGVALSGAAVGWLTTKSAPESG